MHCTLACPTADKAEVTALAQNLARAQDRKAAATKPAAGQLSRTAPPWPFCQKATAAGPSKRLDLAKGTRRHCCVAFSCLATRKYRQSSDATLPQDAHMQAHRALQPTAENCCSTMPTTSCQETSTQKQHGPTPWAVEASCHLQGQLCRIHDFIQRAAR
jgi:hypothetical protein